MVKKGEIARLKIHGFFTPAILKASSSNQETIVNGYLDTSSAIAGGLQSGTSFNPSIISYVAGSWRRIMPQEDFISLKCDQVICNNN